MVNNPKISVIMSVYNGERYLREAIESILGQTFTDFEFIIVNDASTDSSPEIMRSYDDSRIRIIKNGTNIGLTRSLNAALEQARGELIARQDDDDISLPERFEKQLQYFAEHPETAVLGTSIYIIDEDGRRRGKRILPEDPSINSFQGGWFSHGSVMFQTEIVRGLGGYNELFRYSQDLDLWLRITKKYPVRGLPQVLYMLRIHEESIQSTKKEESILYYLLALRMTRNDLDTGVLKAIKDNGIKSLCPYLNKDEKVFFHKAMAHIHMQNNNKKLARAEYRKVLKLSPLDFYNNLNLFLSYLGKRAWTAAHGLYDFSIYT
jgi:glycosyltransferase involved in cell wall biosynthesis